MDPSDRYSRLDYRRLIAWPQRIEREWPFLEDVFAAAPSRRLLDLGCGTGEHARFLAAHGFDVVGVDSSPAMLQQAREAGGGVTYVEGDLADLGRLVDGQFGGAICLGNTLPHIEHPEALARFARGLRERLAPGASLLLQVLNYEKIFATRQRALPVNVKADEDGAGELVFLRLMDPRPDGTVVFTPSTLRYRPSGDTPLELLGSRNILLRGWRRTELEDVLGQAGFPDRRVFGAIPAAPYVPLESADLVIAAR
jgi:SAM-dependent methyltransferase